MHRLPWKPIFLGVAFLSAIPNAFADEPASDRGNAPVIMPGQEQLLGRMLGMGQVQFPGGCSFLKADIQMSWVQATYACGPNRFVIELRNPATVPPDALRTSAFALVPDAPRAPQPLLDALVARIRGEEAAWRWSTGGKSAIDFPSLMPALEPAPASARTDGPDLTPAQLQAWKTIGAKLLGSPFDALPQALALAGENPYRGVLGLVAAAVIDFDALSPSDANDLVTSADAKSSDPARQFAAGVAMQQRADKDAKSDQQRLDEGTAALKYFDRASPAYDGVAELHGYKAISLFRLGRRPEAEAEVARALAFAPSLADSYYVRAEIEQAELNYLMADLAEYTKRLGAMPASPYVQEMINTATNESFRRQGKPLIGYASLRMRVIPGRFSQKISSRLPIVVGVLLLAAVAVALRGLMKRKATV